MKTIDDFIKRVNEIYTALFKSGVWLDRSPYTEDEARSRSFIQTIKEYERSKRNVVASRDPIVVAGRGCVDETVQVLDKEGEMREGLPGAATDEKWTSRSIMLMCQLLGKMKLVHRNPEYQRVWDHWKLEHGPYTGPNYWDEFNELLKHVEMPFNKEAYGLGMVPLKPEGGWTKEFKDEVYGHMYQIYREMDLRLVLDDRVQEASRRLIQAWQEAHPRVEDCVLHRCQLHYNVPQLNSSAPDGVECGACAQESARHIAKVFAEQCKETLEQLNFRAVGLGLQKMADLPPGHYEDMSTKAPDYGKLEDPLPKAEIDPRMESPFKVSKGFVEGPRHKQMVASLMSRWHQRFINISRVEEEGLHIGGFPVMGEVYHRTLRGESHKTWTAAYTELEHFLLMKETFEGDTLYIRVPPEIAFIHEFDSREDVFRARVRFAYTVKKGTVVVDNDAFKKP